jgi:hypothetical protein
MTKTDDLNRQNKSQDQTDSPRKTDDRRSEVRPTDNPVPSSPAPDADAVREGEEKLERIKPY